MVSDHEYGRMDKNQPQRLLIEEALHQLIGGYPTENLGLHQVLQDYLGSHYHQDKP